MALPDDWRGAGAANTSGAFGSTSVLTPVPLHLVLAKSKQPAAKAKESSTRLSLMASFNDFRNTEAIVFQSS